MLHTTAVSSLIDAVWHLNPMKLKKTGGYLHFSEPKLKTCLCNVIIEIKVKISHGTFGVFCFVIIKLYHYLTGVGYPPFWGKQPINKVYIKCYIKALKLYPKYM